MSFWDGYAVVRKSLDNQNDLSFPRKRESSFFALDPCFRRGDIVDFFFLQQILINYSCILKN